MSKQLTIPLSVVGEFLLLTEPPEGEEFGLINACDINWTQADLSWLDKRGDIERLPRFLELAEQINLALQQINPNEMITDTCAHGALNGGLDAVSAFLALHEYGLIVDDTPGEAATTVQVLDFVFEVLGTVGGLTDDSYIFDGAVMLKRPDICKALEIGRKPRHLPVTG